MTIGTGTFSPNGRFAFPRSYINDFFVCRNGDTIVQTLNKFVVTDATNPLLTATFEMNLKFLFWSSNAWTMDFIITKSYYQNTPTDDQHPLPFNLVFACEPATGRNSLTLGWSGFLTDPQKMAFNGQPNSYWLPKPLP